ncbi:hypothetical protein ACLMNJ_28435 [Streptomyces seoulensis]
MEIGQALRIEECWFEKAPKLHGASARTIRIVDSRLPGLEVALARVEGHLDLSRSRVEAWCLDLLNASVAGELVLNGTRVCVSEGWGVIADGLDMGGGVFCMHGLPPRGLRSAHRLRGPSADEADGRVHQRLGTLVDDSLRRHGRHRPGSGLVRPARPYATRTRPAGVVAPADGRTARRPQPLDDWAARKGASA